MMRSLRRALRARALPPLLTAGILGLPGSGEPVRATPPAAGSPAARRLTPGAEPLLAARAELAWLADPVTFPHALGARVEHGSLVVTGQAPSGDVRDHAVRLARQATGLRVLNTITLRPSRPPAPAAVPPELLMRQVEQVLKEVLGTRGGAVQVGTHAGGRVTLQGTVATLEEKMLAGTRLRRVRGCTSVVNQLQVAPEPGPTIAAVAAREEAPPGPPADNRRPSAFATEGRPGRDAVPVHAGPAEPPPAPPAPNRRPPEPPAEKEMKRQDPPVAPAPAGRSSPPAPRAARPEAADATPERPTLATGRPHTEVIAATPATDPRHIPIASTTRRPKRPAAGPDDPESARDAVAVPKPPKEAPPEAITSRSGDAEQGPDRRPTGFAQDKGAAEAVGLEKPRVPVARTAPGGPSKGPAAGSPAAPPPLPDSLVDVPKPLPPGPRSDSAPPSTPVLPPPPPVAAADDRRPVTTVSPEVLREKLLSACTGLAEDVAVTVRPDGGLQVRLRLPRGANEQDVSLKALQVPEMAAPNVQLSVEVAPEE
jgi:hypothetical protein